MYKDDPLYKLTQCQQKLILLNDDSGLTLVLFTARTTLVRCMILLVYRKILTIYMKSQLKGSFIQMKVRFILPATIRKRFSLLKTIEGINFGFVRMYVAPYRIFWIIFTSDLVISYTDKLLVFQLVQIVLHLKPICFYFAMKEIS